MNKGLKQKRQTTQSGKKWHTITVFVRQVQGEQEELDSDKIVPLFLKQKEKNLCGCSGVAKQVVKCTQTTRKVKLVGPSLQVSAL